MALIVIHQSFHFRIAHLIFILSISYVFVFGKFYHHYYYLHMQFNILAMAKADLYFDIITNSSS